MALINNLCQFSSVHGGYWWNFRKYTGIREDLTVYWKILGKQIAPTEGMGAGDRSTRVGYWRERDHWPLLINVVLSQEDQPQTHRSTRQISRETGLTHFSVVGIIHRDLALKFLRCPKSRCEQELTAVIVRFPHINVSQGSVATQLRCGGIFNNCIIANFPPNVSVKELWKSVYIYWSYSDRQSGTFFLRQSVVSRKKVQ